MSRIIIVLYILIVYSLHILACIKDDRILLLFLGLCAFPVGFVHGTYLLFVQLFL